MNLQRILSDPWHGVDGRRYAIAERADGLLAIAVDAPGQGWTELSRLSLHADVKLTKIQPSQATSEPAPETTMTAPPPDPSAGG